MTMVIMYSTEDGGVQSANPALNLNAVNDSGEWIPLKPNQAPPEGYRYPTVEEAAKKLAPDTHIIIDDSELPDRDKRDAWVIQDGAIVIDESRLPKPSPADNAKALLATLPDEMKAKHYSTINNVRAAIENDEWGVVPHLLAAVTPDTPEEAAALQQISEALGAS